MAIKKGEDEGVFNHCQFNQIELLRIVDLQEECDIGHDMTHNVIRSFIQRIHHPSTNGGHG